MCKEHNPRKIDKCMQNIITFMKVKGGYKKYPMTIVVTNGKIIWDLISNEIIPRKKRFYIKDKEGYYFIPESVKFWRNSS